MASHPHAVPSALPLEDRNHDVTGWDTAGKGGETSWYPPLKQPVRTPAWEHVWAAVLRLLPWALLAMLAAMVGALATPNLICSKIATNETAAVQNLKALATAQAQFHKKYDAFAGSGDALNRNGTLIAADLENAFETFHDNYDQPEPQPKAGYLFRMLQSDRVSDPVLWRNDVLDSAAGMIHWAVICRAAEPGTSGEYQYLIGESGVVYKHSEPEQGAAQYKTFLLNDLTGLTDANGGLDAKHLAAAGWVPAK